MHLPKAKCIHHGLPPPLPLLRLLLADPFFLSEDDCAGSPRSPRRLRRPPLLPRLDREDLDPREDFDRLRLRPLLPLEDRLIVLERDRDRDAVKPRLLLLLPRELDRLENLEDDRDRERNEPRDDRLLPERVRRPPLDQERLRLPRTPGVARRVLRLRPSLRSRLRSRLLLRRLGLEFLLGPLELERRRNRRPLLLRRRPLLPPRSLVRREKRRGL